MVQFDVAPASRRLSCGHPAHTSLGWIFQTVPLLPFRSSFPVLGKELLTCFVSLFDFDTVDESVAFHAVKRTTIGPPVSRSWEFFATRFRLRPRYRNSSAPVHLEVASVGEDES